MDKYRERTRMRKYQVHLGIVLRSPNYNNITPIVGAVFVDTEDHTFIDNFPPRINFNCNAPIPITGPIERLEDLVGDYKTRNESNEDVRDDFFKLDYAGDLFIHNRDYERMGFLPVIIAVTNPVCIDRDVWEPISLHHAKEILNQKPIKPENNTVTLKYLLVSALVHHKGTPEVNTPKDVILMTRKTDVFQHSDMCKRCDAHAVAGGFIKRHRKLETFKFYGESVSSRVLTDPKMVPFLNRLVTEGDWYSFEHKMYNTKYTIWAVVPKDHEMDNRTTGITWKKSSHSEMEEVVEAETTAAMGW